MHNSKNSIYYWKIWIGIVFLLFIWFSWRFGGSSRAFGALVLCAIFCPGIFWFERQLQIENGTNIEQTARQKYVPLNLKQYFSLKSALCLLLPGPVAGYYCWMETHNDVITFMATFLGSFFVWFRIIGTKIIWFPNENNGNIWFVKDFAPFEIPLKYSLATRQAIEPRYQFTGQRGLLAFIIFLNIAAFSFGYWFLMESAFVASTTFKIILALILVGIGWDQIKWFWRSPNEICLDEDGFLLFINGAKLESFPLNDLQMILNNDESMGESLKGLNIVRFCFPNRIISMYLDSECLPELLIFLQSAFNRFEEDRETLDGSHYTEEEDINQNQENSDVI